MPKGQVGLLDGLFHQKVGILRDDEGDVISFSGSVNETAAGWTENIEEFKVFRSWEPGQVEFLNHDVDLFGKYWQYSTGKAEAVPLPSAARDKLLNYAPDDVAQLDLDALARKHPRRAQKGSFSLRNYQSTAVQAWFDNGCRGVFEMATATGKTKTAVAALERLEGEGGRQLCVVTAPYHNIAVQWAHELGAHKPLRLYQQCDWRKALANLVAEAKLGLHEMQYICVVQDTACGDDFLAYLADLAQSYDRVVFVGDEMHGLGAPQTKHALAEFYTHRLGLSATPKRWFDEEGSSVLDDFFGDTVFEFGIREALEWRDPSTGLSALCPYTYHPVFVELAEEELQEYMEITEKLVKYLGSDDSDAKDQLEQLLFKRAGIVKQAGRKIAALAQIVASLGSLSHTLIYCHNTNQMDEVMTVLREREIKYSRFTGMEGTKSDPAFGGLSEREVLIRALAAGEIDALVAMKCLDEGVDVPSARIGVLLASSGNPREFIQRRGRLLRRSEGKDHAVIYDLVVAPNITWLKDARARDLERRIFQKELDRINDFAETALNRLDARTEVLKLLARLT